MKKTPKQVTIQTLDKKIDGIASTFGALTSTVGELTDTVDSLARSTKEGFDNIATKQEFVAFKEDMTDFAKKTGVTLFNLDSHARTTNERLDAIEKTLEPLMLASGAMQREFREHERRILHIERKVGLAK